MNKIIKFPTFEGEVTCFRVQLEFIVEELRGCTLKTCPLICQPQRGAKRETCSCLYKAISPKLRLLKKCGKQT